jgi:hypothetical protein
MMLIVSAALTVFSQHHGSCTKVTSQRHSWGVLFKPIPDAQNIYYMKSTTTCDRALNQLHFGTVCIATTKVVKPSNDDPTHET